MQRTRWGILATGRIAAKFAEGLRSLDDAELIAVGSRSQATADRFADKWGVPHRHASYEALAEDPDVDAIYVATPHPMHRDNAILCLRAGKPVLCEKPFAVNAAQAREVIACARENGVFLMEAMWTRFLPAVCKLRDLLARRAIGDLLRMHADFGFRAGWEPKGRLLNPDLAGGGLLDVGVYTVSTASMVFGGAPDRIASMAHLGETGVDEQAAMLLGYGQAVAVLTCAVRVSTPFDARIVGTDGSIMVHHPCWVPTRLTVARSGRADETLDLPYEGNGYGYEASAVMEALRAGRLESDVMPLDETLSVMRTLDALRAQWGLKYPME